MNRLFCWGCGQFGQHGHEIKSTISAKKSALTQFSNGVKDVGCGASHTVIILDDDRIVSWGNGQNGQLGNGSSSHSASHVKTKVHLFNDEHIKSVACGDRHSCLLTTMGNVYGFGCNFYGQLGFEEFSNSHTGNQKIPKLISMPSKVLSVACGQHHTIMLLSNGTVVGLGRNIYGQVGVNTASTTNNADVASGACAVDCVQVPQLVQFELENSIVFITAGQNHSICIDSNGKPYVWGYGRACGLRQGHDMRPRCLNWSEQVVEAAGGVSHSLFLTASGVALGLGSNMDGQLGLGEDQQTVLVTSPLPLPPIATDKLRQVVAGDNYSGFVTCSGQLYMCGRNSGVICADAPAGQHFFNPLLVDFGIGVAVRRLVCGAWHAAVLVEPSTAAEEEEVVEVVVEKSHNDGIVEEKSALTTAAAAHAHNRLKNRFIKTKCSNPVNGEMGVVRERTVITLKDLYSAAASPSPRFKAHSSSTSSFESDKKSDESPSSSSSPKVTQRRSLFRREHLAMNNACESSVASPHVLMNKSLQPTIHDDMDEVKESKKKLAVFKLAGGVGGSSVVNLSCKDLLQPILPLQQQHLHEQSVLASLPHSISVSHALALPPSAVPAPAPVQRTTAAAGQHSIEQIDLIRLNNQRNDRRVHRSYTLSSQQHQRFRNNKATAAATIRRTNSGSLHQQEDEEGTAAHNHDTLERSLKMPRAITFIMERQCLLDDNHSIPHEVVNLAHHSGAKRKDNMNLHVWKREPTISIPSRFASVNLITRTL